LGCFFSLVFLRIAGAAALSTTGVENLKGFFRELNKGRIP
jgi:hypothetical protein